MKIKVTLSIDKETYQEFKGLKFTRGLSISAWISAKMREELEKEETKMELKVVMLLEKLSEKDLSDLYEKYL